MPNHCPFSRPSCLSEDINHQNFDLAGLLSSATTINLLGAEIPTTFVALTHRMAVMPGEMESSVTDSLRGVLIQLAKTWRIPFMEICGNGQCRVLFEKERFNCSLDQIVCSMGNNLSQCVSFDRLMCSKDDRSRCYTVRRPGVLVLYHAGVWEDEIHASNANTLLRSARIMGFGSVVIIGKSAHRIIVGDIKSGLARTNVFTSPNAQEQYLAAWGDLPYRHLCMGQPSTAQGPLQWSAEG